MAAFERRAFRLLSSLEALLADLTEGGASEHGAWVAALVEIGRVSAAHCEASLLRTYFEFLDGLTAAAAAAAAAAGKEAAAAPPHVLVLRKLGLLHGLHAMEAKLGDFLEDSAFLSSFAPSPSSLVVVVVVVVVVVGGGGGGPACGWRCGRSCRRCGPTPWRSWTPGTSPTGSLGPSTLGRRDGNVYDAVLDMKRAAAP